MKKSIYILSFVIILAIIVTACSATKSNESKDNDKIKINTTVFPLKSFANQIGGKYVSVKSIYPTGADLHTYEPTQKDIMNASKADMFLYTGDDLDPIAKKVAATIKKDDKKVSLGDKIDKSELFTFSTS